jgi:ankyrin repeat protein
MDMVRMLLQAGAAVNAKADNGWTALMLAKERGFADIVKVLIEAGAMEDSLPNPGFYFNG